MTSTIDAIVALTGNDAVRVLADTADYETGCPTRPSCAPSKPASAKPPQLTPRSPTTPSPALPATLVTWPTPPCCTWPPPAPT